MAADIFHPVPPASPEDVLLAWYVHQERVPFVNPKPRRHVRSFTYEPKLAAVLAGECDQTIRPRCEDRVHVHPGDTILFHGWEGRPYHSEWSRWRLTVTVTEVEVLTAFEDRFEVRRHCPEAIFTAKWDSPLGDHLAARDHIEVPRGPELRKVLGGLNGKIDGRTFSIIRWSIPDAYLELVYDGRGAE